MKTYIQIGTNTGNDDFLRRVKKDHPDLVILVEPNKEWHNVIRENYRGISGAVIQHVAITDKTGDTVKLVFPKIQENGKAKNGVGYNTGNYSLLPMDDWGEEFSTIETLTMTFSALCDKYGVTVIDYLLIDTEGYDAEIIKTIDFSKYDIKELEYEWWGFDTKCYTRHGEKGKQYGIKGMEFVENLLLSLGYTIKTSSVDSMNKVAIKE